MKSKLERGKNREERMLLDWEKEGKMKCSHQKIQKNKYAKGKEIMLFQMVDQLIYDGTQKKIKEIITTGQMKGLHVK